MSAPVGPADLSLVGRLRSQTLHSYGIRTAMHEVQLRDGSLHRLHGVLDYGDTPSTFLRALRLSDERSYCVFDLRHLSRPLEVSLKACEPHNMPAIVATTLRGLYPNAHALRTHAVAYSHCLGYPAPTEEAA